MNDEQLNIEQQVANFLSGKYDTPDRDTQIDAGWYDWFCRESQLKKKTNDLYKKLISIMRSPRLQSIGLDKCYVFFKNNCPMSGTLYDDFRICDIVTGDVIYTITPKSGHTCHNGMGSVWGLENDFSKALFEGKWSDIIVWFNAPTH